MSAWYIHAFMSSKNAVVHDLSHQHGADDINNSQVESPIINQDVITNFQISCDVNIRNVDDVVCGVYVRSAENLHNFSRLVN